MTTASNDEPGSPQPTEATLADDQQTATQLTEAALLLMQGGADGRAGALALLREIRERQPEALDAIAAGMQLRRLGLRRSANALSI